jgi:hypothetical protein
VPTRNPRQAYSAGGVDTRPRHLEMHDKIHENSTLGSAVSERLTYVQHDALLTLRVGRTQMMQRLIHVLRVLFGRIFGGPFAAGGHSGDPYAGVRQPLRGKPSGRNSAIALAEPEELAHSVDAVARGHLR